MKLLIESDCNKISSTDQSSYTGYLEIEIESLTIN